MTDLSFLRDVLVFLVAAIIVAGTARLARVSVVLGYLAAGMVIGPHGLDAMTSPAATRGLAELGVLFLLFAIGLDMTIDRLRVIRRYLLGLGSAQVLISSALFAAIALWFGLPLQSAIVIGGGLALSSTAVVLQLLSEQGSLTTVAGRIAFSILLLQDLAVVPMLALVPDLAGPGDAVALTVLWTVAKAAAAIAVIFAIGRLVVRPLFQIISLGRNAEMFAATTLLTLLGMSWATHAMGLSLAIGGFMAGLLLAETAYRHQVEADIAPFRGLLLGLFFVSVGMDLDTAVIVREPVALAGLVAGILIIKSVVLAGLGLAARQRLGVTVQIALLLPQGGEFGFILFGAAAAVDVVPAETATLLIAAIAVTMLLTPFLAALGQRLGAWLDARRDSRPEEIGDSADDLRNHVILAGFGRVGRSVARTLRTADVPFIAIEYDAARVVAARKEGLPVYFGDASRLDVLRAAGAERARAAVIIMDKPDAARRIVHLLHRNFPDVRIFVRAADDTHRGEMLEAGADTVVHETLEMSLQLGASILRRLGAGDEQVQDIIAAQRTEGYAEMSEPPPPAKEGD